MPSHMTHTVNHRLAMYAMCNKFSKNTPAGNFQASLSQTSDMSLKPQLAGVAHPHTDRQTERQTDIAMFMITVYSVSGLWSA